MKPASGYLPSARQRSTKHVVLQQDVFCRSKTLPSTAQTVDQTRAGHQPEQGVSRQLIILIIVIYIATISCHATAVECEDHNSGSDDNNRITGDDRTSDNNAEQL